MTYPNPLPPIAEFAAAELSDTSVKLNTLLGLIKESSSFEELRKRLTSTDFFIQIPDKLIESSGYVIKFSVPHPKLGDIEEVARDDGGQAVVFTDILEAQQQLEWVKKNGGPLGYTNIRIETTK